MSANERSRNEAIWASVVRGSFGALSVVGLAIEPLVIIVIKGCLVVGIALELFSLTFPAGTHFPHGLVIGMALFGLVGDRLYHFVVRRFARLAE